MKKLLLISLITTLIWAQEETTWEKGGTVAVNLTQVSLTNWAAGGQNSISSNELISLFAHYKKGEGVWENFLEIGYGSIKQGDNDSWWKTDDKIDFTSKYGRKAFDTWYYSGLLNLKSQMTAGYNYPDDSTKISDLFAPGYLLIAVGLDNKPNENFTAFVSPLTGKITFVNDQDLADAGAFGVEPGENSLSEFGGYAQILYKKELMENVNLQTKLDLFSNYLDKPQNIDISWEVLVTMKVNEYISANISTHLLYDDDIDIAVDEDDDGIPDKYGPRTQFKEVLGLGFSYTF